MAATDGGAERSSAYPLRGPARSEREHSIPGGQAAALLVDIPQFPARVAAVNAGRLAITAYHRV